MKNVELSKTFSQKGVAWIAVGVFPALMVPTMMCMLIYAQIDFKHLKVGKFLYFTMQNIKHNLEQKRLGFFLQ